MTYRTDVEMKNGKMAVREQNRTADNSFKLPEVKLPARLSSDKWDVTIRQELKPYELDNDAHLVGALRTQKNMVESAKSLLQLRDNQNPRETQAAHLERVAVSYDKRSKQLQQEYDRARNSVNLRMQSIESEAASTVGLKDHDSSLIKQTLSMMDKDDRHTEIMEAIHNKDGAFLYAVFNAHPKAIGLSSSQVENYRRLMLQKHRPDLLALRDQLTKTEALLVGTYSDFLDAGDTLTAAEVRAKYAELERKAAEAQQTKWGE
ncbi:hypothetical protein [Aliidiomarina indica]|uniref:hypothetical protein n=1 Tax=Aliidiomarina indica TaxID=2749147 RepID=UPI00189091C5|nr:hypothetical protein [Aliidiomarina indica]